MDQKMDKAKVAAWLNGMTDKQFVEFFYESLAGRQINKEEASFVESRLVLAQAWRYREEKNPWAVTLLCPAGDGRKWVDDAPLCQSGSHCNHDTLCWAKQAICPVCGGGVYGT